VGVVVFDGSGRSVGETVFDNMIGAGLFVGGSENGPMVADALPTGAFVSVANVGETVVSGSTAVVGDIFVGTVL
jgi:hypothetical protein